MSKVLELFGHSTQSERDWAAEVEHQQCPFLGRKCLKNRKSEPDVSIGTCTLSFGNQPVVICPKRFLERRVIFTDCLNLVRHEAGNELHIVPEVQIPGGNVDYFLVSARNRRVRDFVGIEVQTLDTTGTIWPERQRFLQQKGVPVDEYDTLNVKPFGMNWKMTAKTILVQLHHKVKTFEAVNRHLVLSIQDVLWSYMQREFSIGHVTQARPADPLHIHTYQVTKPQNQNVFSMNLSAQMSTDVAGVAMALGLNTEARVELETIHSALEAKMSDLTLLRL